MNERFTYRIWNKREKRYIENFDVAFRNHEVIITFEYFDNEYEYIHTFDEDEVTIEQCTSLKDKNGKLIYEGDWLKTKDDCYCYVVWYDGFWWVKSLPSEAMDLEHSEFYKECEVVGNIHNNPDFMENEE